MAQEFENIATTDFIDTGLLRLLARDLTALTVMSGESDPASSPNDAVIDNTTQGVLKINGDIIIDYKNKLLNSTALANRLQPLSSLLTNFSNAALVTPCFINTNGEVLGLTDYGVSAANRTDVDGSKTLAKKNVIGTPQIVNGSITQSKLATSLPEGSVFKCGDLVRSLNSNNRNGFLKLGSNYSIGSALSNATYRNNSYFDLYSLLWNNPNTVLRDLSLNVISKGATSNDDFANGNSIDLMASDDLSKYKTVEFNYTGDVQVYTVPKNVFYVKVECVGAAGGAGGTFERPMDSASGFVYGDVAKGGKVSAILRVTPGEILYIRVGGIGGHISTDFAPVNSASTGSVPGGYNGGGIGKIGYVGGWVMGSGGGGGGMTDIRTADSIESQILVASGGGGSFYYYNWNDNNSLFTIYGGAGVGSTDDPLGIGQMAYQSSGAYQPAYPGGAGAYVGVYSPNGGTRGKGGDSIYIGAGGGGGYVGGGAGYAGNEGFFAAAGGISWVDPARVVNNSYVSTSAYSEATGNGWAIITPIILPATTYIKY